MFNIILQLNNKIIKIKLDKIINNVNQSNYIFCKIKLVDYHFNQSLFGYKVISSFENFSTNFFFIFLVEKFLKILKTYIHTDLTLKIFIFIIEKLLKILGSETLIKILSCNSGYT